MTWSEFNILTRVFLSVHNRRQGIQPLIDQWIRAAAIDLQRFVGFFQQGHLQLLTSADLTLNGFAQTGTMPDGHVARFRIVRVDPITGFVNGCDDAEIPQTSWSDVQLMACGRIRGARRGVAIDRFSRTFCFGPNLLEDERLELSWNGVQYTFDDSDIVPFDETCAQAAGDYVLARLSRLVDKDVQTAMTYEQSYRAERSKIYREYRSRQFILNDAPYQLANYDVTNAITDNEGGEITDNEGNAITSN